MDEYSGWGRNWNNNEEIRQKLELARKEHKIVVIKVGKRIYEGLVSQALEDRAELISVYKPKESCSLDVEDEIIRIDYRDIVVAGKYKKSYER